MSKTHHPNTKVWNQTTPSLGPRTTYGRQTKPPTCGSSWWTEEPEQFYEKAHQRAVVLAGQREQRTP